MIVSNGYALLYEPKSNRIIITLPQTMETPTDTLSPVTNRKVHITAEEQSAILTVVRAIVENGEEYDIDTTNDYDRGYLDALQDVKQRIRAIRAGGKTDELAR